jgi:phenylacetic acid degradation protein paaN
MSSLFARHAAVLTAARAAIRARTCWSAYPESPGAYGADSKARAEQEIAALKGSRFSLPGHPQRRFLGAEHSPLGEALGVTYPANDPDVLVRISAEARQQWSAAPVDDRAGVCLEILARLNRDSHVIGQACRLTTGQPYFMAFQSGGPHAQERGLEAVAYAYEEMSRIPQSVRWEKPQSKGDPIRFDKTFTLIPRGTALVIACGTFPTWNSYGAIFASLATGNSIIIKPHPMSILPLAITVRVAREVLVSEGFDPNIILLAPDVASDPIAKGLALNPSVAIVDFTGSPRFGQWLRQNARQALVYTEEAGVNSVILDSTNDFKGMVRNIATSLCLYSGQMCTAPQNLFVPRAGIGTDGGHKAFDEVAHALRDAVSTLVSDPARAESLLGAIQSEETIARVRLAAGEGPAILPSAPIVLPSTPSARAMTPLIRRADVTDKRFFLEEKFGPISYLIATDSTAQSIDLAREGAMLRGALTMGVHSVKDDVLTAAALAAATAGVALSCNLTGSFLINQNAAFSDYHVTGANPAGNACLTDSAYVANRFRVVCCRAAVAAG